MVAWVERNGQAIRDLVATPIRTDAHRNQIAGHLMRLFLLYTPAADRSLSTSQMNEERKRRQVISDAFIVALEGYPEWAVVAGIEAYLASPESKFPPKAPGILLGHVQEAMSYARQAARAADKVIEAERLGRNLDKLREEVDRAEEGKVRAYKALEVMHDLQRWTDVTWDHVVRGFYSHCWEIWQRWRKENPAAFTASMAQARNAV